MWFDRISERTNGRKYLYNLRCQCFVFVGLFRLRQLQKQVCCVFVIHACDILFRALGGIMTQLSIPCSNQDISRCTWRKEFLQLQLNIICVVEEEQPVSIALVRKPTQTPIYRLLNIIRSDGLEIHFQCLFIGSVNVEDV